jgi:predicted RNA-binding protein YlqC (UPF0109 family)
MEFEKTPAGSEPINPLMDSPEPEVAEVIAEAPAPEPEKQEPKADDQATRLEKMLQASQSMIGKQGSEIGALRAKLEEMSRPPAGPSDDEQLSRLYQAMDSGEIDIAEGMRQALAINSKLTASKVMSQLQQQQQQGEVTKVQEKFLRDNPDYEKVLESGALDPYLEADPLADHYTAYHKLKADERVAEITKEYEAKILAAKEEGAKLAKGAESAGKVLGKQGGPAIAQQVNRPFKNNQEASAAMLETLKQMRSTSAQ